MNTDHLWLQWSQHRPTYSRIFELVSTQGLIAYFTFKLRQREIGMKCLANRVLLLSGCSFTMRLGVRRNRKCPGGLPWGKRRSSTSFWSPKRYASRSLSYIHTNAYADHLYAAEDRLISMEQAQIPMN